MPNAQPLVAQQRRGDGVHVLDAACVNVRRFIDVEDLAIEMSDLAEVLPTKRRFELREYVVEVFFEAGAVEKIEGASADEQGQHLSGRQRYRFVPGIRPEPIDLLAPLGFGIQRLVSLFERTHVANRGPARLYRDVRRFRRWSVRPTR